MYILSSDQKSVIDSSYIQRFCLAEKPDAVLIIAYYSVDRAVTIGRYADKEEAHGVLAELYSALSTDDKSYSMPDSRLFNEEHWVRDARTKRRGGS